MTREPSTGGSSLSTGEWFASDVYKADVCDPSEHKVGKVTDLTIESNGNVTGGIIGVGGFLGVSLKDVVIPFKELKVSTRGGTYWLVLNRTKDDGIPERVSGPRRRCSLGSWPPAAIDAAGSCHLS